MAGLEIRPGRFGEVLGRSGRFGGLNDIFTFLPFVLG